MTAQNSNGSSPRNGSDVCRAFIAITDEVRVALAIQAHAELLADLAELADAGVARAALAPIQARFVALDSVYRGTDEPDTARLTRLDERALTGSVMASVAAERARRLARRLPGSHQQSEILSMLEADDEIDCDELADLAAKLVASS